MEELVPAAEPQGIQRIAAWNLPLVCYQDYSFEFEAEHWRKLYFHAAGVVDMVLHVTDMHEQDAGQMQCLQLIQPSVQVGVAMMVILLRSRKDEQQLRVTGSWVCSLLQVCSHDESTTSYATGMQKHDPASMHQ